MLQVLVLSSSGARALLDAVRDGGERTVLLASTFAEYQSLTVPRGDWIVVYDLHGFPAGPAEVFAHSVPRKIPVIVVASHFDSTDWIRLFKLGACDVLRSPVVAAELHRSIASVSKRQTSLSSATHQDRWYTRTLQWVKRLLSSE